MLGVTKSKAKIKQLTKNALISGLDKNCTW